MKDILHSSLVSIYAGCKEYGSVAPFSPDSAYPEYPFDRSTLSKVANPAYRSVREALRLLNLDKENQDTPDWNPLSDIVQPGDTVVLKPNFVRDFRETQPGHDDCLITHGSVIRAVLDYVYIALKGRGRLIIADAPQNDADFEAIRRIAGLDEIQKLYQQHDDFSVEVYDLRPEKAHKIKGVIVGHSPLPGDPAGYVKVNLGAQSAFAEINHLCHLLYGSEYDMGELHRHHHDNVHEYLISKTILDADCVISLPKLKTHKKVGLTVNMKNIVGINGNKNWLPHHREGTPAQGGDQFPDDRLKHRVERSVVARFKRLFPLFGPLRPVIAGPLKAIGKCIFGDTNMDTIRSGNWYGNDTTWRMVMDLNRILLYADNTGQLHDRVIRRFFSVVDGIIGGQGNGPLDPTPKPAGVILAGFNPVAVDLACTRLMGFDYQRIPLLNCAFIPHRKPIISNTPDQIECISNRDSWNCNVVRMLPLDPPFKPHFGWYGAIELGASDIHPIVDAKS